MKTKYNNLLKIRKQELDKAEKQLNYAREKLLLNELEFQKAALEYTSFVLPTQGSALLLKQGFQMLNTAKQNKAFRQEKLNLSQKELGHYQNLYKKASINYEKILYLQNEAFKQEQKILKKKEENFLDEMAIIKHFYKGKKYG